MGTFQILAMLGGVTFMLACLFVGGRMLLLSLRTRELPERLLGAALFLWGGIGYPLMMIARYASSLPDPARIGLVLANLSCGVVGISCVAWFNARVFRPTNGWARSAAIAAACVVGAAAVAQLFDPGPLALVTGTKTGWSHLQQLVTPIVSGWACCESLGYFGRMRRQLRLGIADPVVTDRFRLFAIAMSSATVIGLATVAFTAVGVDQSSPPYLATVGLLGLVAAGSLSLAFFPPQTYIGRLRCRAPMED